MAATKTVSIDLGFKAPDFNLLDTVSGEYKNLAAVKGEKGTVVMFTCNHCPFVLHVNAQLVELAKEYIPKGIGFVAISSNDVEGYPQDRPELMTQLAAKEGYPFPYLYDETQDIAKAYKAVCTPDFSIFDAGLNCVYRGQLDSSRPGNGKPVTGEDMRTALDAILAGEKVDENQFPSIGCNIKWKNRIFPDYA
ncbi:MAG: thioredoxin family protein [Chitinophagales bacterium]